MVEGTRWGGEGVKAARPLRLLRMSLSRERLCERDRHAELYLDRSLALGAKSTNHHDISRVLGHDVEIERVVLRGQSLGGGKELVRTRSMTVKWSPLLFALALKPNDEKPSSFGLSDISS